MSTIASPRDPSLSGFPRRANSSQALHTPSSSARPSLDTAPSSPNLSSSAAAPGPAKRANRAALREYYNLRNNPPAPPTVSITADDNTLQTPTSELDSPSFSPESYISRTLESSSLSELLKTYTRVLSEIRALDAEKKALVYDNYSKLITATETIRKMRTTMDPLNPMAGTLDLVVEKVYDMASELRDELRRDVPPPTTTQTSGEARVGDKRERTRQLAREVVKVPERIRQLMEEGKEEEARREWEMPRRLLLVWKEKGVGGPDVEDLIRQGDDALRGTAGGRNSDEGDGDDFS
ncbi:Vps51/Vps67-domain-containing protein [Podospora australis]|uniref:Vacuolar protein sorting-associated protein 51 homolog n=1 Tax=Podospora australis TaxID=1536484 RepID=A0AAN7AM52_9PEZI|nr:Vps51/Vps67-domain-containing protein [Podospora australis]